MALDILNNSEASGPVSGPLSNANPLSSLPTTSAAIDNMRSDVALQSPDDIFNSYLMSMIPSAAQMAESKSKLLQQQQMQQQARQQQMEYLKQQYSPERETALNWQNIGNTGAAMLNNPTNPWGGGATAQMSGMQRNRADLEGAQATYQQANVANANADAAQANALYQQQVEQQARGIEGIIDYKKAMGKNTAAGLVTVTTPTGDTYIIDKTNPQATPQKVLGGNGLTDQQQTGLANLEAKLLEEYGSSAAGIARVNEVIGRKTQDYINFNKKNVLPYLPPPDSSAVAGASVIPEEGRTIEATLGRPYKTYEDASAPAFTPEERAAIDADFTTTRPGGEISFDMFTPEELSGIKLTPPVGGGKMEQDLYMQAQKGATEQALSDQEATRGALAQAVGMSEAAENALNIGAETNALQPFINNFGSVMDALGFDGGLAREAIKGDTFKAIQNQAVQVLQNAAKGPQTEGDAQRFRESLLQVKNAKEANILIAKFLKGQVWKRQAELDFRTKYMNIPGQTPAGASNKWQNWSQSVPVIKRVDGTPVFVQDYVEWMLTDNPEAIEKNGEQWVRQEAIKLWRKK